MLQFKAEERISQVIRILRSRRFTPVQELAWEVAHAETPQRRPPRDVEYHPVTPPAPYGEPWKTFWFRSTFTMPAGYRSAGAEAARLFLEVIPRSDSLLFVNGRPRGAFNDRHPVYEIGLEVAGGEEVEIHVEAYGGHHFPGVKAFEGGYVLPNVRQEVTRYPLWFEGGRLVALEESVEQALFDLQALFETALSLPEENARRHVIIRDLAEAVHVLDLDAPAEALAAAADHLRERMRPLLEEANPRTAVDIHAVGHAHMDHAWLWPIEETTRKLARTFANMARYTETYPEFIFLQSMPAQLEIVGREYPEVFADIREAFARGQWEPNGGVYVESDCTLPAGESLVRQFLYGRKTSRDLLGYEGDVMWLPDVFGYPGNLPQILRGAGMRYFVTSKINWNDTTRFPYDLFAWQGIDGTSIPTAFIPDGEEGYNGYMTPRDNALSWSRIRHKDVQQSLLKPVGEGDGGGGPQREDLELARRLGDLHGSPRVRWRRISEALPELFREVRTLPRWRGELYLEFHRGTYTSQGVIKALNRRAEEALRRLEFLAALSLVAGRGSTGGEAEAHRRAQRDELWKQLLIHQFHDILPGSSIERVNREARTVLEAVLSAAEAQAAAYLDSLSLPDAGSAGGQGGPVLVNPLGRERESVLRVTGDAAALRDGESPGEIAAQAVADFDGNPGHLLRRRLPAGSVVPLRGEAAASAAAPDGQTSPFTVTGSGADTVVDTPFYRLAFDDRGAMASLLDLESGWEFARSGDLPLNTLMIARDVPVSWDAWDIDADHELTLRPLEAVESVAELSVGPVAAVFRRVLLLPGGSRLEQDTLLYAHSRRIDFETRVDWREEHTLLKAVFPTTVDPPTARSGIQYGWIDRPAHQNRDADRAMFEIPAHGYVALTDARRCAAVMAGEKYGYHARDGRVGISLLKSAKAPDETAEAGVHRFTYAFYSAPEPFSAATVVRESYELVSPPALLQRSKGPAEEAAAAPESLIRIEGDAVQLDWVKPAEEGEGIVVRLYEADGAATRVRLVPGFPVRRAEVTNLLEDEPAELPVDVTERPGEGPAKLSLDFGPFEIRTLRLTPD